MSIDTASEASIPHEQTTRAQTDVAAYLEERAELRVEWRDVTDDSAMLSAKPVALTQAGDVAGVADFPSNFSKQTFERYRDRLAHFLETQDVSDLSTVDSRDVRDYNRMLQRGDYARTTRELYLNTLKVAFDDLATDGLCDDEISQQFKKRVKSLSVSTDEKSRSGDDHSIAQDRAHDIAEALAEEEYASRRMIEFSLIYHVGFRISGLLSLNCSDIKPDRGVITVKNEPEKRGVRLKRGDNGERHVNVTDGVINLIEDYIANERTEPNDDTDALLTSWAGRINKSTVYRDIADATKCGCCTDDSGDPLSRQNAADCPDSIGPHDLRRTAVTRLKNKDLSWETIAGRVNATPQTLKKHYDSPSQEKEAERRREKVLNAL
jgi:site-specific recombinase XerD